MSRIWMKAAILALGVWGVASLAPSWAQSAGQDNGGNPLGDLGQLLEPGAPQLPPSSAAAAAAALAARNAPPVQPMCFEVVPGSGETMPGALLVNRCTGKTWVLVRDPISGEKGGPATSSAWRWHPLSYDNREAILAPVATREPPPMNVNPR